jgi:hypothetical protein
MPTPRAQKITSGQPPLDRTRIGLYREHSASVRYPRPSRHSAKRSPGGPPRIRRRHAAAPNERAQPRHARHPLIGIQNAAPTQARRHLQRRSTAVPLNIDLDVVLSVLAHTVCAALRRRIHGYATATPDTLQRRFLNTGGIIENDRGQTTIRLARRTYSPILRQATLPETITVPWLRCPEPSGQSIH